MTDAWRAPEASQRYVLDTVRRADRDRFLGALFAPEPARSDLLAILAFDHELARTRSVTREPMLARIRLEWWREAVAEAAGSGKPRAQPLVKSLSETVRRRGLAPEELLALIDAREEEIDGPLDVLRAGHALADLQLAALGIDDAPTTQAARAVATAWLMGPGPERDAAARRGARLASRRQSCGAAHPAAGTLARRHERLAQAARLLVGGEDGAILTDVPRSTNLGRVISTRSRRPRCRPFAPTAFDSKVSPVRGSATLATLGMTHWCGQLTSHQKRKRRKRDARKGQRHRDRVRDDGRRRAIPRSC